MELRPEHQVSSPWLTCISGFFWGVHSWSSLVSIGAMQVHFPLELGKQCQASCRVDHREPWLSPEVPQTCHMPLCFESVLGVTVESVQGIQVCLECTGTSGVF